MSDYRSHLSVTIWIVLASLTLGVLITFPQRRFSMSIFGSPVDIRFSASFLAGLVALAVTWAGLESVLRAHPDRRLLKHTYRYWGLSTAIVLTGAVLLPRFQNQSAWLLILAATGLALAAAMAGEYHTLDQNAPGYDHARLMLHILSYGIAALAFVLIYLSRSRSLVSATLIGVTSGLLAMELLRDSGARLHLVFLYSVFVALILAQATVMLNYWPFPSVRLALALMVGFYLLVGLSQQALQNRIDRRRVAEYLLMSLTAVAVIFLFPEL